MFEFTVAGGVKGNHNRHSLAERKPRFASASSPAPAEPAGGAGKFARQITMAGLEQVPAALLDVNAALLRRCLPTYSLWSSGSELGGASLLVV